MLRRIFLGHHSIIGLLAFLALPAHAIVVEYQIEAEVSSIANNDPTLTGSFSVGNVVNATLMFDTEKATLGAASLPIQQDYNFSSAVPDAYLFSLELQGDSSTYDGTGTGGGFAVINDWGANGDWFQTLSYGTDFSATAPTGLAWTQTTLTLKDYGGGLQNSTDLPDSIAELNNFADLSLYEENFLTMFFKDGSNNIYSLNAEISSITSSLSTPVNVESIVANSGTVGVLNGAPEHNGGGALTVKLPGDVAGDFTASYKQQSVSQVDLNSFNFVIPGPVLQTWDLHFDNNLISVGEFVDLVFKYDDTDMNIFEELALDVLHEVNGQFIPLGGIVDTANNTITASTPSFSNFYLSSSVPEPTTLALMGLGLAGIGYQRRCSKKAHKQ